MKSESILFVVLILLASAACSADQPDPIVGKWVQLGETEPIEFLPNSVLVMSYKTNDGLASRIGEWKKVSDSHYVLNFRVEELPIVVQWKEVEFTSKNSLNTMINGKQFTFQKSIDAIGIGLPITEEPSHTTTHTGL